MSDIPYRTVTATVSFDYHGMTIAGTVQASRTMLTGSLNKPYPKTLPLTQVPVIACQGSKHGLLNDDSSGLSEFGQRVAHRALEEACSWKLKNKALRAEQSANVEGGPTQ